MTTELTLYYAPDTCARVSMIALEETGAPYRAQLISFVRGDHRAEAFLELQPQGRVPLLLVDGEPLVENVAILSWLHGRFPDAGLLPAAESDLAAARQLADLAWCASGLHPLVTRIRLPQFSCPVPEAQPAVRAAAMAAMAGQLRIAEARLNDGPWWYGERWSIVDAYLNWVWFRITGAGFDAGPFPRLADHDRRITARPSVARTLEIHATAARELADQGLAVNFDTIAPVPMPQVANILIDGVK
ncbi:glutathione S-transferase family protein [Sphingomonas sp. LT1P40]|uniref:glutathione S-transferase family protein n=1 Tax=Alteristakelama amylovorans TaxID=3096166 RepID=UPI002FC6E6AE